MYLILYRKSWWPGTGIRRRSTSS